MLCRILEQWIRPPVVLLMVILAKHYIQERKVQNQNKYPLQLENVLYTEEMIQYIQSAMISLAGYAGEWCHIWGSGLSLMLTYLTLSSSCSQVSLKESQSILPNSYMSPWPLYSWAHWKMEGIARERC